MNNMKKGVSLIVVLMFMLVATIAATATFKWLSSQNTSSATRLYQSEARQSAISGIESARSWMMHHGNETGAILKQYLSSDNVDANGKRNPVVLDGVLNSIDGAKQEYSVAVVGVDISEEPYKIKVVSTGKARNGSTKHSESAIFKVNGLYRVELPKERDPIEPIDFKSAYHGGNTATVQNTFSSMTINGDWSGNPPTIKENFVVTGTAKLSGSGISGGTNNCFGNLEVENGGLTGENLYVEEDAENVVGNLSGDVYFNGNVSVAPNTQAVAEPGHSYALRVLGNMTVNKVLTTASAKETGVKGNFCLCPNEGDDKSCASADGAKIDATNATSKNMRVSMDGNVWIPSKNGIVERHYMHEAGDEKPFPNFVLGNSDRSSLYIQNANNCEMLKMRGYTIKNGENLDLGNKCREVWEGYGYMAQKVTKCDYTYNSGYWWGYSYVADAYPGSSGLKECPKEFYFQTRSALVDGKAAGTGYWWYWYTAYSTFKSKAKSANVHNSVSGSPTFQCGLNAKTICDKLWVDNTSTCEDTKGNKHMVPDPLQIASDEAFDAKANKASCVTDVLNGNLDVQKNGITKLSECYESVSHRSNRSSIFYSDSFLVVKATADQLYNVLYLANSGQKFTGKFVFVVTGVLSAKLPPTSDGSFVFFYLKDGGGEITGSSGTGSYNYFFYSLKDISSVKHDAAAKTWNGTFYFPASSCAGTGKFDTGNMQVLFNEQLLKSLGNNGVVCSVSASSCGEIGGETGSESSGTGSGSESGSGATSSTEYDNSGYDSDFIAVGSQLNIELESEYKSSEGFVCSSNDCGLKQSIMVVPRIIYITKNPKGKLSDYYSVVALNSNGVAAQGNGSVSCSTLGTTFPTCTGSPGTSGNMYTGTDLGGTLENPFYRFTYSEAINGKTESSVFYVKVNGQTGETPAISFGTITGESSGNVELNSTTANDVYLTLKVDDASLSYQGNFSIDIKMTTPPSDKWVVTLPDGSAVPWSSGNVYTYSGPIPTSPVSVLKLHTDVGARSGSLMFNLRPAPLVNCNLGSSTSKIFNISGKTTVYRKSVEQYCTDFPDNCEGENEGYKNASSLTDYSGSLEWISADGESCNPNVVNNEWECESGTSIYLRSETYDSKYYSLFLPTENNSIEGSLADGTEGVPDGGYVLYASLKKKKFAVNVSLENASSGRVKIYSKNNLDDAWSNTPDKICSNDGCTEYYDADTHIKLVASDGSGDVFNYWTCSEGGVSCNTSEQENAASIEFTLDDSYSYVAHFNKKDPYCFYSDFANTSIWCSDDMMIDCIDYCATGTSCSVMNTHYAKSGWMLVKSNSGSSFAKPRVTDGYLYKPSESGTSLILNTADGASSEGGANGAYTTRIKAGNVAAISRDNYMKNSGYVVRSNATGTEYILVSVYTVYGITANGTYTRVCYVNTETSTRTCKEYEIKSKNLSLDFYAISFPINLTITLNGKLMDIDASYSGSAQLYEGKTKTIDLTDVVNQGEFSLEDDLHPYLGVSLADDAFKVGDLSWHISGDKGSKCFADPSASCSFAANYLGGLVPGGEGADTLVYPWVGFSSWFTTNGQDCVTKYYYNGCDMPSTYFKNGLSSLVFNGVACGNDKSAEGYYQNYIGDDGLQVNDNGKYMFGYEGLHGFAKDDGFVRNASIVVDCRDVNGHRYEASCGEFFVGKQTACTKNEPSIFLGSDYLSMESREYSLPAGTVLNMRDATLQVRISDLPSEASVYAKICDEQYCSQEKPMSINGNNEVPVKNMSDVSGFNPEKIVKVVLRASASATITSIASSCPNAVGINSCSATYNGEKWTIDASNLKNSSAAKKCRIKSSLSAPEDDTGIVSCQNSISIDDPDFYTRINTGDATLPQFELFVYDDAEATETSSAADSKECTLSGTYSPVTVECRFEGQENFVEIFEGSLAPKLTYEVKHCPESYCNLDVKLTNGTNTLSMNSSGKGLSDSWAPVTGTNDIKAGSSYRYTVRVYKNDENGNEITLGEGCKTDYTFDIKESKPATATCTLDEDEKKYHYEIHGATADYGSTDIEANIGGTLLVSDALGNSLGTIAIGAKKEGYFDLSKLTGTTKYVLTLKLGTNVACNNEYIPEKPVLPALSLSCPVGDQTAPSASFDVYGCDGGCSVTIDGSGASASYSSNKVNITGATAGSTYNVKVTRTADDANDQCSVKFAAVKPTFNCPSDGIVVDNQNPTKNVSIDLSGITGCDGGCSWNISGGTTASDNLNGTSFSFAHDNKTEFYLNLYKDGEPSDECKITVNYLQKPTFTCPIAGLPTNQNASDPVSISLNDVQNCGSGCTWTISGAKSASGTYNDGVSFTHSGATGSQNYSLKLNNGLESDGCDFQVTYAAGGDDEQKMTFVDYTPSGNVTVENNKCFSLSGTWGQYNTGLSYGVNCWVNDAQSSVSIKITSGGKSSSGSGSYYVSKDLLVGTTKTGSLGPHEICASYTGGSSVTCGFKVQ